MRRIPIIIGVVLLATSFSFGHKYHTSLSRIEYNAQDKNLEISIRLFVHDVGPLLENRLRKPVDLEKTPEVDAEIQKYLAENFLFKRADGSDLRVSWVGKEFESDTLFVYVECPFEGDPAELSLQNTLFFDMFAEQTNLVVAKFGDQKFDLAFKSGDRVKPFRVEERKKTVS